MEVQQCMKLTGTNSSFGLITLIAHVRRKTVMNDQIIVEAGPRGSLHSHSVLRWLGGYCEGPEPDPIPNSAVKLLRANGTKS